MPGHRFDAELWEYAAGQPGSWHFITLPLDVADDVLAEAGPRRGFGSVRVEARIGTTTWRTSLFPDAASASLVLPVKKDVRTAQGIEAGSRCEVTLELVE
jgi:hypothetical protein